MCEDVGLLSCAAVSLGKKFLPFGSKQSKVLLGLIALEDKRHYDDSHRAPLNH
jgi:hypothetical protein